MAIVDVNNLHPDDLIGAVRHQHVWRLFAGTVAEWILDYPRYDPSFDPAQSKVDFRNNLLRVDETNAAEFCEAMKPYELLAQDIQQLVETGEIVNWPLMIMLDFDNKVLVNEFREVPIHEYVPAGWTAYEDLAIARVPESIQALWTP